MSRSVEVMRWALWAVALFGGSLAGVAQGQAGGGQAGLPPAGPKSKAEATNYEETSRHAEVVEFFKALQAHPEGGRVMRMGSFGKTGEGRELPLVMLSSPAVSTPEEAAALNGGAGRPIVFVMANIHAGEVEGKEAVQHVARRMVMGDLRPMLDKLVVLIAPNYNADGNEKFSLQNRTAQNGPIAGVGVRENAQGLDLNRDFIKMDAPETRALIGLFNAWDPLVTVDLHSTNGSYTAYHLTYSIPLNPMTDGPLATYHRETLMPALTKRMLEGHKFRTYYYGNFSAGQNPRSGGTTRGPGGGGAGGARGAGTAPAGTGGAATAPGGRRGGAGGGRGGEPGQVLQNTVPMETWYAFTHQPRIGQNYVGLRNRFAILSEAYTYLDFKGRIDVTAAFVEEICAYTMVHGEEMRRLAREADARAAQRGKGAWELGVAYEPRALPGKTELLAGEVKVVANPRNGANMRAMVEERVIPVPVTDYSLFGVTRTVPAARAYVFKNEPGTKVMVEKLVGHGIRVEALNAPAEMAVEAFTMGEVVRAANVFQGHREATVTGTYRKERVTFEPGTVVVKAAQPLGTLAAYLLEPESDDGFTRWAMIEEQLGAGKVHPVYRVMEEVKAETREVE